MPIRTGANRANHRPHQAMVMTIMAIHTVIPTGINIINTRMATRTGQTKTCAVYICTLWECGFLST